MGNGKFTKAAVIVRVAYRIYWGYTIAVMLKKQRYLQMFNAAILNKLDNKH